MTTKLESPPAIVTQDVLRRLLRYEPETGHFYWLVDRGRRAKAGDRAGTVNRKGRRMIEIYGRSYVAARLAWLYMHGEWPEHQIDHRDRDRLNDAASNLRSATGKQNCENRGTRADNRSGVPGVHHRPEYTRPWLAKIGHEGRQIHIGTFATKDEAVAARRAAERRYFTHKEVIT